MQEQPPRAQNRCTHVALRFLVVVLTTRCTHVVLVVRGVAKSWGTRHLHLSKCMARLLPSSAPHVVVVDDDDDVSDGDNDVVLVAITRGF